MDGLNLSIDSKNYKLVKMDRVIAIEVEMDIERTKILGEPALEFNGPNL